MTAGGCSGFTYELSFADGPDDDDAVIEASDGVRVLVDPKSGPIVRGSTLEYNDALLGGGLKMINPQATHECACGDSFALYGRSRQRTYRTQPPPLVSADGERPRHL